MAASPPGYPTLWTVPGANENLSDRAYFVNSI
jgi:hypothetical protein